MQFYVANYFQIGALFLSKFCIKKKNFFFLQSHLKVHAGIFLIGNLFIKAIYKKVRFCKILSK